MTRISVNFDRTVGAIKPMHGVGQPPIAGGKLTLDFSHVQHLTNAGIPYSRLHDVGGAFGGNRYVDIPNIFRNFDADETDPASYDFAFTDELMKALDFYGIRPIFRLGVTIENQAHIKAYHIHPPKDYAKWARICEHIIRHYNEGWANGFFFGIEYWEIWNEPENGPPLPGKNQMWTGTAKQFYELYDVAAKHLKACFGSTVKVGGYGASGLYGLYYHPEKYGVNVPKRAPDERYETDIYRVEFFNGFLEYIQENNTPIDFFSWHSYANEKKTRVIDEYIHRRLTECGYGDLELQMNEWNNVRDAKKNGTSYASAATAAMICAMQNSHTHILCYYDARLTLSPYGGFFDGATLEPLCTYYVFDAFNQLYTLKNQAECICDPSVDGLYAVAATNGEKKALMVVNRSEEARSLQTNLTEDFTPYLLDEKHFLTPVDARSDEFILEPNQIVLLKNN